MGRVDPGPFLSLGLGKDRRSVPGSFLSHAGIGKGFLQLVESSIRTLASRCCPSAAGSRNPDCGPVHVDCEGTTNVQAVCRLSRQDSDH